LKVTARQVELMRLLPQGRRVPFRDVVDMLQDHRTAVFRTVIELEVRELLVVRRSSTDRRAKLIRRSRKGDRLMAAAMAAVATATGDLPNDSPQVAPRSSAAADRSC
jgi:DNA-binding MarR family transcriptional regulator